MKKQDKKIKKLDLDLDQALREIAKTLRPIAAREEAEEYDSSNNGSCHDGSGVKTLIGH